MTSGSDRHSASDWRVVTGCADVSIMCEGDEFSSAGARLLLRASDAGSGASVGIMRSIDAAEFHGRVVVLSSILTIVEEQARIPAVWIRADGPSGKLEFATSAMLPDIDARLAAYREIVLRIPFTATSLAYGVVFDGGVLHVDGLVLRTIDARQFGLESTPDEVMTTAIDIISRDSLHADDLDWPAARAYAREAVAEALQPVDLYPAIRNLLARLGDRHSHLVTAEMAHQHRSIGVPTLPVIVESLPDGIGYVRMAGFIGGSESESAFFVSEVASRIAAISIHAENGWVLDLRLNSGGNLWPMLASLMAFLGNEVVGGFKPKQGEVREWRAGDRLAESAALVHASLETAKVAVLLGPKTCSSGEALAVAFHGRPDTRSFGQPTSGMANANATCDLPDGSQLQLTTAICVDRHGKAFGKLVDPDETVISSDDGTDAPLRMAVAWLLRRSGGEATALQRAARRA